MFPLFPLSLCLWLEQMDPGLILSHKSQKKTVAICKMSRYPLDMLRRVRFKSGPRSFGTQRAYTLDDYMDAVLGDALLSGNVILHHSSVCHDDIINLGNSLLCGDGNWPSTTCGLLPNYPCHV